MIWCLAVLEPLELNLRHLRAFCEVVAFGSISAAAERVHLSQPAITQAIAKLERAFRVDLFTRSNSGMAPTEGGALLADRAQRALTLIQEGANRAHGGMAGRKGRGFAGFDRLVTWSQLRALLAVAEARNFSLAARAEGISQPSLHRLARDLERLAGVAFYLRTPQGIALTPAAAAFARHGRLALAELRQVAEELSALRGVDQGSVVIGALPLARTSILPKAVSALARARPEARVRIVDGAYDDLLAELRQGGLDVLVGALRLPAPIDDVVQSPLFADRLSVIGRRDHPLGKCRRVTLSDLVAYPWIAPRSGPPGRAQFDALFAGRENEVRAGLVEASSFVFIRGLLMESDRLTLLSAHQAELEIRSGLLEIIPFETGLSARTIGMTVRRDWRPTATQAQFLELLREVCQQSVI